MAKVLVNGQWFEEVTSHAMYESDFEHLVKQHSNALFPNYRAVPFKRLVSDEDASAKADFALVHREYRDWWVVEVEMAHHSLDAHVAPQVKTLSRARYGEDEARYMCQQSSSLDPDRLRSMMKGTQPRVLVVVNSPRPEWKPALTPYGALIAVMEIFRSQQNQFIYRINGETPAPVVDAFSKCYLDKQIPRLLVVESPGILTVRHGETMRIRHGNGVSDWVRIDAAYRVWLSPSRNNPLESKKTYRLSRLESGEFELSEDKAGKH